MRTVKDPALRREDILNAAHELFIKEGYENTTVENIVQKAGIAKGSFYNYFKSKEDVMDAVITRMAENILVKTKEVLLDEKSNPKQRLCNYIDFSFQLAIQRNDSIKNILTSEKLANIKLMYDRALGYGIKLIIPVMKKTLEAGQELNEFSILNADFTAAVILGAFRQIHVSFYETFDIDFDSSKKYIYDFLSRILQTDF